MTTKSKHSPFAEPNSQPASSINAHLEQAKAFATGLSCKPAKKSAQVIALLGADVGATLDEVSALTGWQSHTCRAFFTGLRKKGRVLERSHRADGASVYKLVAAKGAA